MFAHELLSQRAIRWSLSGEDKWDDMSGLMAREDACLKGGLLVQTNLGEGEELLIHKNLGGDD